MCDVLCAKCDVYVRSATSMCEVRRLMCEVRRLCAKCFRWVIVIDPYFESWYFVEKKWDGNPTHQTGSRPPWRCGDDHKQSSIKPFLPIGSGCRIQKAEKAGNTMPEAAFYKIELKVEGKGVKYFTF